MRLRRGAPKPGASMGPQSSANARECASTFIREPGYPEMRVYERGGRAELAPSLVLTPHSVPAAALSM
jgi:hypothetical protein